MTEREAALDSRIDAMEALRTAQRFEALGRLAGGVAHDFNNALLAISGYVQILLGEAPAGSVAQSIATSALDSIGFATDLARQLLEFSRGDSQPETIALDQAVARFDRLLRCLLGDRRKLVLQFASDTPSIRAVPSSIGQVLLNLVANARDAMPEGGTVEIATAREGDHAVLSVRDDGEGMSSQVQARVFEPLFTTKPKGQGTGLGLATVRAIVDALGGRVEVESAPGRGTVFTLRLPSAG
ncbi:MAG: ATP-binding protein [Planctomycetota bacterium]